MTAIVDIHHRVPVFGSDLEIHAAGRARWPGNWWRTTGVDDSDVWCVYQPLHAPSLADSYKNLALPGTRDAAIVTPPTLDADGWACDGIGQYVISGLPTGQATAGISFVIRFSDVVGLDDFIMGNNNWWYGLEPNNSSPEVAWFIGNFAQDRPPVLLAGTLGHAGQQPYRNGVTDNIAWAFNPATVGQTYLGAKENGGVAQMFCACKMQGAVWYNKVLTGVQMGAVMTQLAAE